MSNLFKVPASLKTISSSLAGCVVKAVAPVILVTSKPAIVEKDKVPLPLVVNA